MANININVGELICEDPIFTSVTYTGIRYEFDLNWTSQASYLSTFDNTVTMYLRIECYDIASSTPYYSSNIPTPPPIPFDGVHFLINVLDYVPSFSPKDRLIFRLSMSGETTCNTETIYEFPPNTLPN